MLVMNIEYNEGIGWDFVMTRYDCRDDMLAGSVDVPAWYAFGALRLCLSEPLNNENYEVVRRVWFEAVRT